MEFTDFGKQLISLEPHLFNFALKLTRSHQKSQDLVQETFLKAWRYKDQFRRDTNFKAWVFTIMRNSYINNYRKNYTQKVIFDTREYSYLNNYRSSNSNMQESILRHKEIMGKIMTLKEGIRSAFLMYIEGYKYKEISHELNLPIGTVKSRIFFARKQLTWWLEKR
ncbi:sigma-70 family RNA polymerase sigma factor [Halosquirtibacter xylanolyticus]|uniref:sigma-70 family RNA polymerase sigma factor n=1 Tax=Halosquirtibacter xylanolyticus TaxID=3374599 RepID=UPI003749CD2C|nr:sigma-70 family RNA polymerase sigma factor [Prolixibacteraceae bacterium]